MPFTSPNLKGESRARKLILRNLEGGGANGRYVATSQAFVTPSDPRDAKRIRLTSTEKENRIQLASSEKENLLNHRASKLGSFVPEEEHKLNVIIPYDQFLLFMTNNFCCQNCHEPPRLFERHTVGIATSINWYCSKQNCHQVGSIKAKMIGAKDLLEDQTTLDDDEMPRYESGFDARRPVEHYDLNNRLLLTCQQLGGGGTAASLIGAMLDINTQALKNQFTSMEETIGLKELDLGKAIIGENLREEKRLSEIDDATDRSLLDIQMDTSWSKRGSGHIYNSSSGQHLAVGNKTQKVIKLSTMSRECAKCDREKIHDPRLCSKNYTGSSKGMEGTGALKAVTGLYEKNNCFVQRCVIDDDSSTRALLSHSYNEKIAAGLMQEKDIPRFKSSNPNRKGAKKPDRGKLPLGHWVINFVIDKNHRVRAYAKRFFALAGKAKKYSLATKVDALRMKRNMAYFIRMYHTHSFEVFLEKSKAVLEHHFNNHEYCGDWCPARNWSDDEKVSKGLKYRSKTDDAKLYTQFKEIHESYTTEEAMRELYHEVHTNTCESLNNFITKFSPKHMHYCRTISGSARTHMAISIASIGYEKYFERLFAVMGITMTSITQFYFRKLDLKRVKRKANDNKPEVKQRQAKQRAEKIAVGLAAEVADKKKGLTYESGMAGPQVKGTIKTRVLCEACGLHGHKTRRAVACLFSTNTKSSNFGCNPPTGEDGESDEEDTELDFVRAASQDSFVDTRENLEQIDRIGFESDEENEILSDEDC